MTCRRATTYNNEHGAYQERMRPIASIMPPAERQKRIAQALGLFDSLILFTSILASNPATSLKIYLRALQTGDAVLEAYARLYRHLLDWQVSRSLESCADIWQSFVLRSMLTDENAWTRAIQSTGLSDVPPYVQAAVRWDVRVLQLLYHLNGALLHEALGDHLAQSPLAQMPTWSSDAGPRSDLAAYLARTADWADSLPTIAAHIQRHGTGIFAQSLAFFCQPDGTVRPIAAVDTGSALCGYDEQRDALHSNTRRLLAGLPSHDVLLYGARGTGKSTAIRQLLSLFDHDGLRMIELPAQNLDRLDTLYGQLRGRAGAFIVFIDDLSFEGEDTHFKHLKSVLEGGVVARPSNVRVYATSNRRHLIKERFADRSGPLDDDLHLQDTMEEKLSLSDRFGLSLLFQSPDQALFLRIVQAIVSERGLILPPEMVRSTALRAAQMHSGRSGRTARQIVDDLEAAARQAPDTVH